MATWKSYVIPGPQEPMQSVEKSLDETIKSLPKKGGLVKIHYAGVCHSDLHYHEGSFKLSETEKLEFQTRPGFGYPKVPGHEISGEVYALGSEVGAGDCSVAIGDKVCVFSWVGCDECLVCSEGETGSCSGKRQEIGMCIDGGYAQFVVIPHVRHLLPLPSNVPMELACTLSCGCLTAYNACKTAIANIPDVVLRTSSTINVAIIGLGGLGQWALKLFPLLFPSNHREKLRITGIDVDESRLEDFLKEGSIRDRYLIDMDKPGPTLAQELTARSGSPSFHAVIDFVNNPTTFMLGCRNIRRHGVIIPVGLFGGTGEIRLPLLALLMQKVVGIQTGSLNDFAELLRFLQEMKEDSVTGPFIQVYPLDRCSEALEDLKNRKVKGRAVLKCN